MTRRNFCKDACLSLGFISPFSSRAQGLTVQAHQGNGISTHAMQVEVTSSSGKRLARILPIHWSDGGALADIEVSTSADRYPILGFGAAFTDASCRVLAAMGPEPQAALLREMYGQDNNGFSTVRIPIGASDYSESVYSYDDGASDPDLLRFSTSHDRSYIMPALKAVLAINPSTFFFGSAWSPPGWMKYSATMLGGTIRPQNIDAYSRYLKLFVDAYARAGIPISALTTQNEIDADQAGKMPACPWTESDEATLITKLANLLKGTPTQIWTLGHNYDLWGRAADQLSKTELKTLIRAVAWHGYSGTPDKMRTIRQMFPEVEMHWTEGFVGYEASEYLTGWCDSANTFIDILNNGAQSITVWNVALDEHGKPNIGPFRCGGLVTIHSQTGEVVRSGMYWALAHFSRAIRRGALHLSTSGRPAQVKHLAFRNVDGSRALIVCNKGPARKISVSEGRKQLELQLEPDSITSAVWA